MVQVQYSIHFEVFTRYENGFLTDTYMKIQPFAAILCLCNVAIQYDVEQERGPKKYDG